jgi:hypothetical protein
MRSCSTTIVLAFSCALLIASAARAQYVPSPLTDQYTLTDQTTQLGTNEWLFSYNIYNDNQEGSNWPLATGLGGFEVLLPTTAVISDITTPPSYSPGGNWTANGGAIDGYLLFWGGGSQSTYPIGAQMTCSFVASDVTVGPTFAQITTYWSESTIPPGNTYFQSGNGAYYSEYNTTVDGPQPVPEPASASMLLIAGMGMLMHRRRKPLA